MKVFHHNDLDGRCAAAIALQRHPNAECIEINYNQTFPLDSIQNGEAVYILDYSIEPEEMLELLKITPAVVWIDHHKTAIEKYKDFQRDVGGQRRTDHSGAWLTWGWFHRDIKQPEVVRLVDDWDMWTHEKNLEGMRTREFVAGMKAYDSSPRARIWSPLFATAEPVASAAIVDVMQSGAAILSYEARQNAEYVKAFGHEFYFEDHNCHACNRGITNSKLFDSIEDPTIDIFIPFVWDGFKWTVSLYSKTVDVSEIAKKYGGGGHTNTAGFVCENLPWLVKDKEKLK